MALIEWREEFETGSASIDHEHREMIGLINALHGALGGADARDAVTDFLDEINAHIAAHFALEERMMRDIGYPEMAEHKADHEHLLDEIRDIMERHAADEFFDYEDVLAERLRVWFTEHFRTQDARLEKYLK